MKRIILFIIVVTCFFTITGCSKQEQPEQRAHVSVTLGAITTIYGTAKTEKAAHKQVIKYDAYEGEKYEVEFYCPTCGREERVEVDKSIMKKFQCDCLEKRYAEIKFTYQKQNKESEQEAS